MKKRLPSKMFMLFLMFFCMGLFFTLINGQEAGRDVVIGKQFVIKSEILGEDRPVMISLPRNYGNETRGYPVLYVLDGGVHFLHATTTTVFLADNGRAPKVIVVAIPNTDRNRDFTPTVMKNRAGSGGGENFLKFMKSELFPFVEKNYRTAPYRILFGHSLTAMFSVYTLFAHPDMFNAHIAVSPFVMYDNGYVLDMIEKREKNINLSKKILFFTLGNEPAYIPGLNRLQAYLRKEAPKDFKWNFREWKEDDHGSVPLKSLYFGFENIYNGWRLPLNVAEGGIKAIEAHVKKVSEKYAYTVIVSEGTINAFGYQMLQKNENAKAVEIFKYNVKYYPESANVYDSLGDGYKALGEFEMARRNYETAVKIAKKTNHANLRAYETNLGNLLKEMQKN